MQQVNLDFSAYITDRTRGFVGREWVFAEIDEWLSQGNAPRCFILTGEPGIGKTAIAARLVQFATGTAVPPTSYRHILSGFLSAAHFCSARHGGWIAPDSFTRSLSAQLAERYPAFAEALAADLHIRVDVRVGTNLGTVLGAQITNYYAESTESLFHNLVRQPLQKLCQGECAPDTLVILVDGLDESLGYVGPLTIVRLLATCDDLPSQVRLLLTSRPVDGVLLPFQAMDPHVLYAHSAENQRDIRQYVHDRFATSTVQQRQISQAQVEQVSARLTGRGQGNFLVVSKVLGALERGELDLSDPELLPADLQDLYVWFLERLVKGNIKVWRQLYRPVLGILVVAQEPMDCITLSPAAGLKFQELNDVLHDLRELLDPALDGRFQLYHESVVDFLTSTGAGPYQLEAHEYHEKIAASYLIRYGSSGEPWSDCDCYGQRHLPAHLAAAEQREELRRLLLDFGWIQAKLVATDVNALLADFVLLPNDVDLHLVRGALRLAAQVLAQDPRQLAGQLLGRLPVGRSHSLDELRGQAGCGPGQLWLRPLTTSLVLPGGVLLGTLAGHMGSVWAVAVTRDSQRAISYSSDRTCKVWDLATGQTLVTLVGEAAGGRAMPDGQRAISASHDDTLKVWDLTTGQMLTTLSGHKSIGQVSAVTPDGRRAICVSEYDSALQIWDLQTGQQLSIPTGLGRSIQVVVVTPDSRRAITVSTITLHVWDLITGQKLATLAGHLDWVLSVVVTPDGRRAISASRDQTLKVWDLGSGQALITLRGHMWAVNAVAVTPDGRRAISASDDKTLKVWDIEKGRPLTTLTGHTGAVNTVTVTPDGRRAISSSRDQTLKLWDLEGGQLAATLTGHTGRVNAVAVTPDGLRAISASDDRTLKVWDLTAGQRSGSLASHAGMVWAVAVTPDGRRAISASGRTLRVWDLTTGRGMGTFVGHLGMVLAVAVTPDSRWAISASEDRTLKVWDLATGRDLGSMIGHRGVVNAVVVTPDGRRAVSASDDHTLKVWDLTTGQELDTLTTGHMSWVQAVAVTPDGWRAISASEDHTLKVWDLATGHDLGILADHTSEVKAVAVTSDGRRVIFTSGRMLKVWDIVTGQELGSLTGHTSEVNAVAVTPDGRRAISASRDKTFRVWDLESRQPIALFSGESCLCSCAVAPDGRTFVVGEELGQVHFLRLEGDDE